MAFHMRNRLIDLNIPKYWTYFKAGNVPRDGSQQATTAMPKCSRTSKRNNLIDGRQIAPACPQLSSNPTDENCLTLDIYKPIADNPDSPIDLLVWIHGGAMILGASSEYGGITQAQKGNIVIAIQYRLGVLGYLHSFDVESGRTIGGNYGLNDQLNAIQFIHGNKHNLGYNRLTLREAFYMKVF